MMSSCHMNCMIVENSIYLGKPLLQLGRHGSKNSMHGIIISFVPDA